MAPPCYNDMGKKFKDLFSKQFPAGFLKCSSKFPVTNGMSVNFDGSHKISNSQFTTNIEAKAPLKIADLDIVWIEKWTTKNELSTNLEINVIKDLTNGLEILYEPSNGQASFKSKNSYKSEQLMASTDIKFKTHMPEISLSFMTNLIQGVPLYGGGTIDCDTKTRKVTNMGFGIQLEKGDVIMSAAVTNNAEFFSQLHMKLSNIWEIGLETGWSQESKKSRFAGVTQFKIGADSFIKSKLASCGSFSMGYSFLAIEGIRMTLGFGVNTQNLTSGGQEFGLQIEI